jgi:hypothetical protein
MRDYRNPHAFQQTQLHTINVWVCWPNIFQVNCKFRAEHDWYVNSFLNQLMTKER